MLDACTLGIDEGDDHSVDVGCAFFKTYDLESKATLVGHHMVLDLKSELTSTKVSG